MSSIMSESKKSKSDHLQRFVFDESDARGCIVQLKETCEAIQATHHYPANLAKILNQFTAAVTLMRDSIKIDGSVTMQLRSQGVISLIMADCMSDRAVRAIAEYDAEALPASDEIEFDKLGDGATLAITITPDEGERYQAIVPIENANLEQCLEDYFARSEQLPTWFKLLSNTEQCVGIAIHALPTEKIKDLEETAENFTRLKTLLSTLDFEESISLEPEQILRRLFHEESCRVFTSHEVKFGCHCSMEKSRDALKALGAEDLAELVAEEKLNGNKNLVVDCHFCFQRYEFEIEKLGSLLI